MWTTAVAWSLSANSCSLWKQRQVKHKVLTCYIILFVSDNQISIRWLITLVLFVCVFLGTLKLPDSVKWLKLNYRNTGFYIVHYGDEGWKALIDALNQNISVLTHEDRASLIHNMFALSRYAGTPTCMLFSRSSVIRETESRVFVPRLEFEMFFLFSLPPWPFLSVFPQTGSCYLPSGSQPVELYKQWNWHCSCDWGPITAHNHLQAAWQKTGTGLSGPHEGTHKHNVISKNDYKH